MQLTFGDAEGLGQRKQTRRERFLAEMDQVVPWKRLLALLTLSALCNLWMARRQLMPAQG